MRWGESLGDTSAPGPLNGGTGPVFPRGSARELRVALYSHDTMGLGHIRRNLGIARALAGSPLKPTMLLLSGAREAHAFELPPRTECVTVPALHKESCGTYRSRALGLPLADLTRLRARTLRSAVLGFDPDVFIVDKTPRGVLQELDPTLELLRARGRARCVLGLREVLDEPEVVRSEWRSYRNVQVVRRHYRSIWVYGDPEVYDTANEYGLPGDLRAKLHYTGYLDAMRQAGGAAAASRALLESLGFPPGRLALCLLGGGQDGSRLAEAFAAAELPSDTNAVLVTGPFMPARARRRLRERIDGRARVRVLEFVPEPELLLPHADSVVAMGGYNTVCALLGQGTRALIVPRVRPRREQQIRAERLKALGLVEVALPSQLCPKLLSRWLAPKPMPPRAGAHPIDLNGLSRVPELLAELLGRRPARPRAVGAPHA